MRSRFYLILVFFSLLLSCSREQEMPEIVLEPTPIMTRTISWGVVNVSYLKINKETDNDQHIVTTLRKEEVVRIENVHYINKNNTSALWYYISKDKLKGWVQDSSLDSYPTKEQALTASAGLLTGSP